MPIALGNKVSPFSFNDHDGKPRRFPEDFAGGKTAIFFLRHLGCPLCHAKIAELKAAHGQFEGKAIKLIVVVQSTPKRSQEFAAKEALPFMLAPDRERKLYDLFEVRRGGLKEYMAPAVLVATVKATLKGHLHGKFEGDEFQVPASFLFSPGGEVIYAHYGKDISDFGSVEEMLAKA